MLSRNPIVPTPPPGDNSNRAAPTSFVTGGGGGGITSLTGQVLATGPGAAAATLEAGIAATNVGALGGTLTGTLPNPGFGHGAITAAAGAATLNSNAGVVTSEALVGATTYTLTLTNSKIVSTSTVLVTPYDGAATGVQVTSITVSTNQVVVVMAMAALTGTVVIPFAVFN
jgi:hypothetical protein